MAFIDTVLQEPSYGWSNEKGELVKPTRRQLWNEAFRRINFLNNRRNWISAICWVMMICMLPFLYLFLTRYFSITNLFIFLIYAMIVMGTHGTIWFHRYCTHHSYTFSAGIWRILTQNLVIKTFPEEIYVISHHVHHVKSDQPGDPYNPKGGFLYCMLSYVNHQSINQALTEQDYNRVVHFMRHTGISINTYKQYQKWGSVASPIYTVLLWLVNWACWYTIFYFAGGHSLACTLFSAALFWYVLIPAFNYTGHGKGEEKHADGVDFDRSNLSINQWRPGYFAGEWHNNHHLYPASARSGFLNWQMDIPWLYIRTLHKLGAVKTYHDSSKEFLQKYANCNKVKTTSGQQPRTTRSINE